MALPDVKEKWIHKINQVTLGATKEKGGTREKTITVGGQTTLPFFMYLLVNIENLNNWETPTIQPPLPEGIPPPPLS